MSLEHTAVSLRSTVCFSCTLRFASRSRKLPVAKCHRTTPPRTRSFSQSHNHRLQSDHATGDAHGEHQAYPLRGYYSEILRKPVHSARTHENVHQKKEKQELSPAERASIVFGTRLASPGYSSSRYDPPTQSESTWKRINGVAIPPRPPEPDNCCMSGCVHCVWDDYRDEVESWAVLVQKARNRKPQSEGREQQNVRQKTSDSRRSNDLASASVSMDDDGGGSETNWDMGNAGIEDDLFVDIPVGIREFMKTEKRLKEKHLREPKPL